MKTQDSIEKEKFFLHRGDSLYKFYMNGLYRQCTRTH